MSLFDLLAPLGLALLTLAGGWFMRGSREKGKRAEKRNDALVKQGKDRKEISDESDDDLVSRISRTDGM